ncbi:hypothetical protein MBLNU457_g0364t2 [Dothideomycetes sp. NU457]
MASEEPQQRSSSGSGRSASSRARQNPAQQLSQIEKSVTHLLVATKQLLETLTQWSRGQAVETDVSDVYVRLGYEFNIACRAFNSIGVETQDLGPVPDLLRGILEETLSQEASQAALDQFLPRIRDIIINLLTGLKKKQSRLRQKSASGTSNGQQGASRQVSIASTASNETTMTQSLEDAAARQSSTRSYGQRHGSGEVNGPDLPPRSTSVQSTSGRQSPRRDNMVQNGSLHRAREPSRETLNSNNSSVSSTTLQDAPVIAPYPTEEKSQQSATDQDMPPPPPPPPKNAPVQKDALAALQRGGDLERRASRRFSAYQIQKHLGTVTGVSMMPPAQNSPIPNRGRDAQESINAVRTRSTYLQNRQRSAYRGGNEASPLRNESRRALDTHVEPAYAHADNVDSPNVKTPEDKLGHYPFPEMAKADAPNASATVTGPVQDVLSLADGDDRRQDSMIQPKSQYQEAKTAPAVKTPTQTPQQFIPYDSPQSGKELTLFLQYKSKIKKFVLPDAADLTIARLQLAFIEKFNWNTQNNGVDLPEIYVQDHVSGVRHELEDLSDIKERSVLVLNVEPLDEVKRHFDDGMGGLRRVVEGIRSAVDDQQSALQLVSDRQQETAKEIANLAAAPPTRSALPTSTSRSSLSPKGAASQLDEVQSLRRDLAVVRQTYQSFVADVNATMGTIRTKASSIKTKAEESKIPNMPAAGGRAYVNNGKKNLQDDSERIVTSVDDLQDTVEDLRKDVVTRGVRPLPRQLETVSKEISTATAQLKKLKEFLKREKPVWTKIWEKELQVVCDDRDLLTMQEELCVDLEDDLEKAAATFALVEQATRQQNLDNPKGGAVRSASKTLNPIALDRGGDPLKAKDGVLGEVKALRPNHESRLEAIERAEKARQKELEERKGGEFQKELGSFVEEGKLKKSGGVDEVERLRKAKDERARKEFFERQSARAAAAAAKEAEASKETPQTQQTEQTEETTGTKPDEVKEAAAEASVTDPMVVDFQASQEFLNKRASESTNGPEEPGQPGNEGQVADDDTPHSLEVPDRDNGATSPAQEFVEAKEEPPTPSE